MNKVIVSGVSLILVVGVVIGVVATVNRGGSDDKNSSPQMKSVSQMCQPTDYKEVCTQTLSKVNSTDPKEFIRTGILAIQDSLKKSLNLSEDLVVKVTDDPHSKVALEDCKELLNKAVQSLNSTFTKISDSDMKSLAEHSEDFRIWLSYVISYQELCIDGFQNEKLKGEVQKSTDFGSQLTDNVLNILGRISDVFKSFGLQFNIPSTNGRLLQENGYPTWVSAADRKLLAARDNGRLPPNAVVALDGSGQFKSVAAALNACPKNAKGRCVIYVKAGIYTETVTVEVPNVYMYGDGPRKTIFTGKKSFKDGVNTWKTATFIVEADGFIARSMGFQNTAGPDGHQAVAVRVNSDMSVFYNCRLDGYQDTLCYQAGRQFYRNCVISGTVDFLFGYGAVIIQNSLIIVRMPNPSQANTVTADGRKENGQPTGLVIHNCRIVPEQKLVAARLQIPTYLGRPWKQYSRTVVMESQLGDLIRPEGWLEWPGQPYENTLYYAEYGNSGPGAVTNRRVKWKGVHLLGRNEALAFTPGAFFKPTTDWINNAGVAVLLGLKR
ncbi:hypothetical protein K2173_015533 [Erythroxylum novogranatense]|uniref:pectinesterase n=1 Tax=Erythroxylum novogranatense TaxID=1862640 RepID=A0AAV8SRX1_9ROSI|nr:hypothetical protein K2173_015533 [Erythroxylum novogranatense]